MSIEFVHNVHFVYVDKVNVVNYFAFRGKEAGEVERILREKMGQRAVTGGPGDPGPDRGSEQPASVGPVRAAVERAVRAESEVACREALGEAAEWVMWACEPADRCATLLLPSAAASMRAAEAYVAAQALALLVESDGGELSPAAAWVASFAAQALSGAVRFVSSVPGVRVPAAGPPVNFEAERMRREAWSSWYLSVAEEARRVGSDCYPVMPWALIVDWAMYPDDGSPVASLYGEDTDVVWVIMRGRAMDRWEQAVGDGGRIDRGVTLALAEDGSVVGVTVMAASTRHASWRVRTDFTSRIPGPVFERAAELIEGAKERGHAK